MLPHGSPDGPLHLNWQYAPQQSSLGDWNTSRHPIYLDPEVIGPANIETARKNIQLILSPGRLSGSVGIELHGV